MTNKSIYLYRDLLRKTRLLPEKTRSYYRVHIKENFIAHDDEVDPERQSEIIEKAEKDAAWILEKASLEGVQKNLTMSGKGKSQIASLLALVLYMASSSLLIILNKHLMVDDGFRFPLFLTASGQVASVILGLLVAKQGFIPLKATPSLHFYVTRLLPLVACTAGTLFFGNICYLYLSVSFIQIIKAAAPAFTLVLCMLSGLESFSLLVAVSVFMVSFGTGLATLIETGTGAFSWLGFACIFFSTFLEAVRVVYTQQLLGSLRFNAVEVVVWLGPPTALILYTASFIWEAEGLARVGFSLIYAKPLWYLFAVSLGFVVNVAAALGIQKTSSLTFKVVGCVKNTVVVWCGILLGDRVEGMQMLGYTASLLGFLLYSRMKLTRSRPKKE